MLLDFCSSFGEATRAKAPFFAAKRQGMLKPAGIVGTANAQEAIVMKAATKEGFEFFMNVLGKWTKLLLTFIGEVAEVLGKSLMKNTLYRTASLVRGRKRSCMHSVASMPSGP